MYDRVFLIKPGERVELDALCQALQRGSSAKIELQGSRLTLQSAGAILMLSLNDEDYVKEEAREFAERGVDCSGSQARYELTAQGEVDEIYNTWLHWVETCAALEQVWAFDPVEGVFFE